VATTSTERRPVGAVMASAIAGFRTLARQHLELTKIEVVEAASVRGQGVGLMAAAAVVVRYAIGFLAAAGAAALALVWPVWAAILTVAVVMPSERKRDQMAVASCVFSQTLLLPTTRTRDMMFLSLSSDGSERPSA
jgi:Putative Actinobacterial Holin-X, holin superfamily III